jgi:Cu-Zn family superoxide dismutase
MTTGRPALPGVAVPFRRREDGGDKAFTYDEAAVPVGSSVYIEAEVEGGRPTVTFSAFGLAPDGELRCACAHAAVPQPSESGPRYQNDVDPAVTLEAATSSR